MRTSVIKAITFSGVAVALLPAGGFLIGTGAALAGISRMPSWTNPGVLCGLLLSATIVAVKREGLGLDSLGLIPTRSRRREFAFGLLLGVLLFTGLAVVRGAMVGAVWTFNVPASIEYDSQYCGPHA